MHFRPSRYSGHYGQAEAASTTGSDVAAGIQAATSLFQTGASIFEMTEANRKERERQRRKRKKKKKQATPAPAPALLTAAPALPAVVTEEKVDWAKWGLVGLAGVAVIAVIFAMRKRSSDAEPERLPVTPRRNPKPRAAKKPVENDEPDAPDEEEA